MLTSWCIGLDFVTGTSEITFASIWHPISLDETVPVGLNSMASDITFAESGQRYLNHFVLDLSAKNATITFKKWVRVADIAPSLPDQRDTYIIFSGSYGKGSIN